MQKKPPAFPYVENPKTQQKKKLCYAHYPNLEELLEMEFEVWNS